MMNLETDKVIGIIGGMGPQAGSALFDTIFRNTIAQCDQEHLSVMLMSFPKHIMDRTLFLEGIEPVNPAFTIVDVIRRMENAGAGIIGIACNTSHAPAIFDVVVSELNKLNSRVKIINMPVETCRHIREHHKNVRRVGLMTTNGTFKAGVYRTLLEDMGYEVILPDHNFQNDVIHKMIYDPTFGIKSNPRLITDEVRLLMDTALDFFRERKSDAVILGCTELSLTHVRDVVNDMLVVDSTEILAKALIREAQDDRHSSTLVEAAESSIKL